MQITELKRRHISREVAIVKQMYEKVTLHNTIYFHFANLFLFVKQIKLL